MPVVNIQVDSRDDWRSLNRSDDGNLVAAQEPNFPPASVEPLGDMTRTTSVEYGAGAGEMQPNLPA
jgi:hypothetical protein